MFEGIKAQDVKDSPPAEKGPLISVNRLTGKAGVFYEKLRYLIDYKEEHTLRRNAIQRILKRKLSIEKDFRAAAPLLQEMVSGGYLPNNIVSESAAHDIQLIIDKYLVLQRAGSVESSRIISLAAREIERFLYPHLVDDLVVEAFYQTLASRVKYEGDLPEGDVATQIYLGCRISLLDDDRDTLFYSLLNKYFPEFAGQREEERFAGHAERFVSALKAIDKELENPLGQRISARLKNHSIYFSVIRELAIKYGADSEILFQSPARLEQEIRKLLAEKYAAQSEVVSRSGTRAVVYIFLTKIVLAFILELPYERLVLGSIDYFALGVNAIFHPVLLLMMVKTIKLPLKQNTNSIITGVNKILNNQDIKAIFIKPPSTNAALNVVLAILYAALFAVSFGFILWVLNALNFNIVGILLFLFFLTLISYFGFRIRYNAKKWLVTTDNDNFFDLLWNFFTIPIVRTGRWLSRKFAAVNIFMFFMDFVLETPFKLMLQTFDEFISFLREKKEDYK